MNQFLHDNLPQQHPNPDIANIDLKHLFSELPQHFPFPHLIHDSPLLLFNLSHILSLKAPTQHLRRPQHVTHALWKDDTQVVNMRAGLFEGSDVQLVKSQVFEVLV